MAREVAEEVRIRADHYDRLLGLLISDREDVDRVHVGLMHEWLLDRPDVEANSSEIGHATFQSIETLKQDPRLEEWGRLALNMITSK